MQKHAIEVPPTSGLQRIVLERWYFADQAQVESGMTLCEIASVAPPEFRSYVSDEFGASLELKSEWNGTLEIVTAEGSVVLPHETLGYVTTTD